MDTKEWLENVTTRPGNAISVNAISRRSGIAQATLNRHVNASMLTADEVIAIARAYDYPVVQGLLDLGHVTMEEARTATTRATLADLTDEDLSAEILRRLTAHRGTHPVFDQPLDELPDDA